MYTGRVRRIPVVRGAIVLYETLALGVRALTWSSQVATGAMTEEVSKSQLAISLGVHAAASSPSSSSWGRCCSRAGSVDVIGNDYLEVVAEGLLRLAMLVGYIWLIGRIPDVQRVFAYHGAEHRAIHAYEHGRALTPDTSASTRTRTPAAARRSCSPSW